MNYYLIGFFMLFFGKCFSQVKVEGYVKDSLGNPLELANVIAINLFKTQSFHKVKHPKNQNKVEAFQRVWIGKQCSL